jgi:hypothetical protein
MHPNSQSSSAASQDSRDARRRRVRRFLLVAAWVITLVALFYAEEDWRGRAAWRKYKQQMQAQGTPLALGSLTPKPVPDEQNFAMTPALAPLYEFVPGTQRWRDTNAFAKVQTAPPRYAKASRTVNSGTKHDGDWARGLPIDLQAWSAAFQGSSSNVTSEATQDRAASAKAVLAGLEEWNPLLDELRAASQRPFSRFNIRYEEENSAGILLPHLSVLKRYVQVLNLRACAELTLNQAGLAYDDIELALKLTDSIKDEPILISVLVRMSELRLALQPVWEGMAGEKWSAEQLKALQQKLAGIDVLAAARRGLDDDRAALGNSAIEFVRKSPSKRAEMVGLFDSVGDVNGNAGVASVLLNFVPSGWFYAEEVEYNRLFDRLVMPLIDLTNRRVSPELASKTQQELATALEGGSLTLLRRHRLFARVLVPAVSGLVPNIARTQTAVDLGTIACALERYQLANGHYPAGLEQLVPSFLPALPHDVIDGKPLRYRLAANRFVLYSVGWNDKDDGGEYPQSSQGSEFKYGLRGTRSDEPNRGDWVWQYPSAH